MTLASRLFARISPGAALLALLASLAPPAGMAAPPAAAPSDLYAEAMGAIAAGRQDEAEAALAEMTRRGPQQPGDWLDLAHLNCVLGRKETAEQLYLEIEERFDPPASVRDVINQQRQQGCAGWQPRVQWRLAGGRGHDSNVNQGASNPYFESTGGSLELLPEYLPRRDGYTTLSGDYMRDLSSAGDMLYVLGAARRHDSVRDYDTASLFVGLEHPWRMARWRFRAIGTAGLQSLGGKLYQTLGQAQLRVTPPLPLPKGWELSVLGGIGHSSFKTISNFDSNTMELRAIAGWRDRGRSAQFSIGTLRDHAIGERPGGDRRGYNAALFLRSPLYDKLGGELDLVDQRWHGDDAYSPGLIDIVRRQRTRTARMALTWPVSQRSVLQLEWRGAFDRENISIFQYDARQLHLSWQWYGGN
ncbi:tetratricopeptide repeat protein [Pseudoduganella umbonata]|uniref:Tetratricopeptide repeat protein n=1 Tax=Pseudoduganella umbonata TaxID=864828 RepID=A0A4P8HPL2_9BURK|nr:tetratricopeptide repeat protein [Pseudoduganella umbonata]MBB3220862.1 hypothetical protein [Pseudoduganella umbonata]QCP11677.1 tetratricopeptide repeat protein [Pseudoduganella umbonata]